MLVVAFNYNTPGLKLGDGAASKILSSVVRDWTIGSVLRYQTGEVLRVPAVHKDGRRLSIAFTVALLCSPTEEIQAIAAIIRDETNRWNEDQALRQRLAELEAKNG